MKKVCFLVLFLALILCGCSEGIQSDIFALPEMPETHSALIKTVEEVCSEGFEFAEPRSGFNRRPLNLVDIDGDGEDEGIVFLREIADANKTYIYIFEQSDSFFSLFDIIEGSENEIYTVSYSSLLDREGYELIVKWGANEERGHALTAYTLTSEGIKKVLDLTADQYSVSDIDGDGKNDLLAVVKRDGHVYADVYSEEDEEITKNGSVALSQHESRVIRILSGKANANLNAAFIERESEDGIITDVVVYKNDGYVNLVPEGDICSVRALCADVNGDGIVEMPKETGLVLDKENKDRTYVWRAVNEEGDIIPKTFTYHSFIRNWYLSMPMSWRYTVSAREQIISSNTTKINFFTREKINPDAENFVEAPLFSIYVYLGSNKKSLATEGGKFIISERDNVIIAGEVISEGYLGETINEEFIKSAFKTRESDWASEILFA